MSFRSIGKTLSREGTEQLGERQSHSTMYLPACCSGRERERELRREGGKSLLAYVKGVDPYLIYIDRPTTIRSPPEHISGLVSYPPAYVIWAGGWVFKACQASCILPNSSDLSYEQRRPRCRPLLVAMAPYFCSPRQWCKSSRLDAGQKRYLATFSEGSGHCWLLDACGWRLGYYW